MLEVKVTIEINTGCAASALAADRVQSYIKYYLRIADDKSAISQYLSMSPRSWHWMVFEDYKVHSAFSGMSLDEVIDEFLSDPSATRKRLRAVAGVGKKTEERAIYDIKGAISKLSSLGVEPYKSMVKDTSAVWMMDR